MDCHWSLLEDNLQWCRKAKELAGRHEQHIESLERELENKTAYIKAVEITLAELSSRVDGMEGKLCRCGQVKPMQEEPPVAEEELVLESLHDSNTVLTFRRTSEVTPLY